MIVHDEQTQRYFEENTPIYSAGRYAEVVAFLREDTDAGASLLDIGCGSGNVLKLIIDSTPIGEVAGVDVSARYLDQCRELVGCETYLGSILDPDLLRTAITRRFKYVLIGAVLHHLVSANRAQSFALAKEALRNAWALVEVGGGLIVMEPTFRPRWLMSLVFYVKRLVSRLVSTRVSLFGYWNNLGEPIVSYYSHTELFREAARLTGGTVVFESKRPKGLPVFWRLVGITERSDSVFIIRKDT